LQREVKAVLHFLGTRKGMVRTGLDIGFTNSWVSQTFRQTGGYWMTVEMSERRRAQVSGALGDDTVLTAGRDGDLPFEDKQFDAVVVSCAMLAANPEAVPAIIRECHRVIKVSGHLIFTVTRQQRRAPGTPAAGYSEADIFHLLCNGFDVIGFRYSCRFWVERVRKWERRNRDPNATSDTRTRILYTLAKTLDLLLLFTKGYQMTVFGHRKGWRERRTNLIAGAAPVSDAVLCDPRRNSKSLAAMRFK